MADNTQNVPAPPPGYSADDVVSSSASSAQAPPPPPGYSADQVVATGQDRTEQPEHDTVSDLGKGFGAGAQESVAGLSRMGLKIPGVSYVSQKVGDMFGLPGTVGGAQQAVDSEAQQNKDEALKTTAGSIGYGGETLAEFLMGDEALQGLSFADKMLQVGKVAKLLEGSPKLMRALKAGANMEKAKGSLSPEALEAIEKNPFLGRLVSAGMSAIRNGVVQGSETGIKTGDWSQAAKEGGAMIAGSGLVGAALAPTGAALAVGGKAAGTVAKMSQAAADAPSEQGVFSKLGDSLTSKREGLEAAQENELKGADESLSTSVESAKQTRQDARDASKDQLSSRKSEAEQGRKELEADADKSNVQAQALAHTELLDTLNKASESAETPEAQAKLVSDTLKRANSLAHEMYEEGITGEDGIESRLEGHTTPIAETPISKTASEVLERPVPEDHQAVAGMKKIAGNRLSADVREQLENISNGVVTKEGKDGEEVSEPMKDLNIHDLIQLRQSVRSAADKFDVGDVNARALRDLIPSIDETIEKMAQDADDPEAADAYSQLRGQYRNARTLLDSDNAEKLSLDPRNPGKAMNDVGKYLTTGNNSLDKIATMRKISNQAVQGVAQSTAQQLRDLAKDDPEAFLKKWEGYKDEFGSNAVRKAFFGPELEAKLDEAAQKYKAASSNTEQVQKSAQGAAKNVEKAYKKAAQGESALGARAAQSAYEGAVKTAQDAYDKAIADTTEKYGKPLEPFKGSFMNKLSEGRVNEALKSGQVDVQDVQNVKKAIGADKWQDVADGVFQRAVADASPNKRFDPEALFKWWDNIKPAVRSEMFNLSDPAFAQKYAGAMKDVEQAANTKKLIKVRVLYPVATAASSVAGAGLGAVAGSATGVQMVGSLGELIGMFIGMGHTAAPWMTKLVDWAANHPQMWNRMAKGAARQEGPTAKGAAKLLKYGAGRSANVIFGGAAVPLGGVSTARANPNVPGQIEPGNIELSNRPIIYNADGSHSSEYSVSFRDDRGREVLVPTIVDGKFLTPDGKKPAEKSVEERKMFDKAWQHYLKTGENLGAFDTAKHADAYADVIHNRKQ